MKRKFFRSYYGDITPISPKKSLCDYIIGENEIFEKERTMFKNTPTRSYFNPFTHGPKKRKY